MMKIEFEDGSFLQLDGDDNFLDIIQCAKKDRKVIMSSSKLSKEQAIKVLEYINQWANQKE